MKHAAVGFRVHSGWAALIALTVTKGAPVVLVRERIHLVKNFTYEYRQPYHTAEKLTASGSPRIHRASAIGGAAAGPPRNSQAENRTSRAGIFAHKFRSPSFFRTAASSFRKNSRRAFLDSHC